LNDFYRDAGDIRVTLPQAAGPDDNPSFWNANVDSVEFDIDDNNLPILKIY
jgi:hypothetical protein